MWVYHRSYTLPVNELVTVRELRNNGAEVLGRVERGERIVVTRDGAPVAELSPYSHRSLSPCELIRRRRNLPHLDADRLRSDIDSVLDASL